LSKIGGITPTSTTQTNNSSSLLLPPPPSSLISNSLTNATTNLQMNPVEQEFLMRQIRLAQQQLNSGNASNLKLLENSSVSSSCGGGGENASNKSRQIQWLWEEDLWKEGK